MPQPRQTPLEMERSRLRKLERRRELYGDRCSTRASDVERQRKLVRQLESEIEAPQRLVWLPEPVTIPGSTVVLVGWDQSMCGRPSWLPAEPFLNPKD